MYEWIVQIFKIAFLLQYAHQESITPNQKIFAQTVNVDLMVYLQMTAELLLVLYPTVHLIKPTRKLKELVVDTSVLTEVGFVFIICSTNVFGP